MTCFTILCRTKRKTATCYFPVTVPLVRGEPSNQSSAGVSSDSPPTVTHWPSGVSSSSSSPSLPGAAIWAPVDAQTFGWIIYLCLAFRRRCRRPCTRTHSSVSWLRPRVRGGRRRQAFGSHFVSWNNDCCSALKKELKKFQLGILWVQNDKWFLDHDTN